jgi:flagellar FliL protein
MAEHKQDGEEKKSPKTIIIRSSVAVIFMAAGVGGTFFLMKGGAPKHEEEVEHVVEKLYFDIAKPIVVNFPKNPVALHGRITVSMLVEGAETLAILKTNEPMIRNNLLMLIASQDVAKLNTREGKELLRQAILDNVAAVIKKMEGKGHVEEIFFTSFVMQ